MFKDLKQILRKEQCDASILLTANVPSTKKIIVHGPQGKLYRYILGLKQIGLKIFSDSSNYLLPTKVVTENSHICYRIYILHSRFSPLTKITPKLTPLLFVSCISHIVPSLRLRILLYLIPPSKL